MKTPSISNLIRLALLRGLLRLGGFVLRRVMAPAIRPATARSRAPHSTDSAGRIIDGEFKRIRCVDPRHNTNW